MTSSTSGARPGRDLEVLVALIETLVSSASVEVRSPEMVTGPAGVEREVDVTIRGKIGSSPVFVMVECRDRASTQGVDWIDQVRGKAEDLRPDKVVVVSASAFSEGARKTAAAAGIELRLLQDLTVGDLLDWVSPDLEHVVMTYRRAAVLHVSVDAPRAPARKSEQVSGGEVTFQRTLDGVLVTIDGLWEANAPEAVWAGLDTDERRRRVVTMNFTNPADGYALKTGEESHVIKSVTFEAEVWVEEGTAPVRRFRYVDAEGVVAEGFEFQYDAGKGRRSVAVTAASDDDGGMTLSVAAQRGFDPTS